MSLESLFQQKNSFKKQARSERRGPISLAARHAVGVVAVLLLLSAGAAVLAATAGGLDISFGTAGKALTPFPDSEVGRAVALQPDGKVVVAGGPTGFAVARYTKDGQLDPTFGNGGIFLRVLGPSTNFAHAVAIQADGRIVVAGESGINNPDHGIVVMRLNANGTLDTNFAGDGIASFEIGSNTSVGNAVAVQPNGGIVVTGSTLVGANAYDAVTVRFTATGTLDPSFGAGGVVTEHNGPRTIATAVALLPDGRVLVGGTTYIGPFGDAGDWDFAMVRYNANGSRDTSFGAGGFVVSTIGAGQDIINALALQPDGKIVTTGSVLSDSFDLAIVRYNAAGQLDIGHFGSGGKLLVDFNGRRDYGFSVAVDPNGYIVSAGFSTDGVDSDIVLVRCEPDGDLDATFGTGGKVRVDFGGVEEHAYGMALQPTRLHGVVDGYKIVTAGDAGPVAGLFGTARFHSRTGPIDRATVNDFDDDGISELAAFRPSNGNWIIGKVPATGTVTNVTTIHWGAVGDKVAPGDYDGDGKYDTAVFRAGSWYILNSADNSLRSVQFGLATDIPVPADYDGDGRTDVAVFRPSTGAWYYLRSSDGSFAGVAWGANGDIPVVGDFDGDDKADLAVYRGGIWYILQSGNGQLRAEYFGLPTDKPVAFDYDGDSKTDIAVFRAGDWYVIASHDHSFESFHWGQSADVPVPGHYGGSNPLAFNHGGQWWILGRDIVWVSGPDNDIPVPTYFAQ